MRDSDISVMCLIIEFLLYVEHRRPTMVTTADMMCLDNVARVSGLCAWFVGAQRQCAVEVIAPPGHAYNLHALHFFQLGDEGKFLV